MQQLSQWKLHGVSCIHCVAVLLCHAVRRAGAVHGASHRPVPRAADVSLCVLRAVRWLHGPVAHQREHSIDHAQQRPAHKHAHGGASCKGLWVMIHDPACPVCE